MYIYLIKNLRYYKIEIKNFRIFEKKKFIEKGKKILTKFYNLFYNLNLNIIILLYHYSFLWSPFIHNPPYPDPYPEYKFPKTNLGSGNWYKARSWSWSDTTPGRSWVIGSSTAN